MLLYCTLSCKYKCYVHTKKFPATLSSLKIASKQIIRSRTRLYAFSFRKIKIIPRDISRLKDTEHDVTDKNLLKFILPKYIFAILFILNFY